MFWKDRVFTLTSEMEIYFGDVFIGYQRGGKSRLFINSLNHSPRGTLPPDIKWDITDTGLYANGNTSPVIEIKNSNFNQVIWNRLHFIHEFEEEHNYYAIRSEENLYTNFLTSSYKEAVQMRINLTQKCPEIKFEIKPLLLQ